MSIFTRLVESRRPHAALEIADEAVPRPSFYVLVLLSTGIATYGLLANSTAVVIGAMLIAPLMGPIFGIALGLVRDDRRLFFRAIACEAAGVALVIALAFIIGLLPLRPEFGTEILGRTKPNLYDLLVAIAAGVAGGYARVSERVSPALPGVAIATALVPPLAVCGLCLSDADWSAAFGALVLFVTNLLAIEIAAALVFITAGLASTQTGERRPLGEVLKHFVIPTALLIPIAIFLAGTLLTLVRDSRLTRGLRAVLSDNLTAIVGAEVSEVRHQYRDGTLQVVAVVLTPQSIEPAVVTRVESALQRGVDPTTHLVIRSLISRDADRTGQIFMDQATRTRVTRETEQRSFLTAVSGGLRRGLDEIPGADLIDLQRDQPESVVVRATVRAPAIIDPARVERLQAAASESTKMPIKLIVRSVLTTDADDRTYLGDRRSRLEYEGRSAFEKAISVESPDVELTSFRLASEDPFEFVATVTSASSLNGRTLDTWRRTLAEALGRPALLTIRTVRVQSIKLPLGPQLVGVSNASR